LSRDWLLNNYWSGLRQLDNLSRLLYYYWSSLRWLNYLSWGLYYLSGLNWLSYLSWLLWLYSWHCSWLRRSDYRHNRGSLSLTTSCHIIISSLITTTLSRLIRLITTLSSTISLILCHLLPHWHILIHLSPIRTNSLIPLNHPNQTHPQQSLPLKIIKNQTRQVGIRHHHKSTLPKQIKRLNIPTTPLIPHRSTRERRIRAIDSSSYGVC